MLSCMDMGMCMLSRASLIWQGGAEIDIPLALVETKVETTVETTAADRSREPTAIRVTGAGCIMANGRFVREGSHFGCPRYIRDNLCIVRSAFARARPQHTARLDHSVP